MEALLQRERGEALFFIERKREEADTHYTWSTPTSESARELSSVRTVPSLHQRPPPGFCMGLCRSWCPGVRGAAVMMARHTASVLAVMK
jgi:hypothetical protein